MENIELKNEMLRLTNCKTIKDSSDFLELCSKCFFTIITNHKKNIGKTEEENNAKIIFQMMFVKILYLKQMINGVSYNSYRW